MMRKTSICVYTVFCIFVLGVCVFYMLVKKLINILKEKKIFVFRFVFVKTKQMKKIIIIPVKYFKMVYLFL